MERPYRRIAVDKVDDIFCVSLRSHKMDEPEILEMVDELMHLIENENCRKLVLCLGPGPVNCLYSVFLAKLVMLRRVLAECDGQLRICDAATETVGVFEACQLKSHFEFCPDRATAIRELSTSEQRS